MQIVVLGMHRSGTSAVTGLLVKMGAYFGPPGCALPTSFDNPRGFWERLDVMTVNDELLASSGANWMTPQLYEPAKVPAKRTAALKERVRAIARELAAQPLSVIKDPRLCITADDWLPVLPQRVCLLVLRNPLAVAKSLHTRNELPIRAGLALWEAHARASVRAAAASPRVVLDFDELMTAPATHAARLFESLARAGAKGLLKSPTAEELAESLDAGLQHHQPSRDELIRAASPAQMQLFDQMRAGDFDAVERVGLSAESRTQLDRVAGPVRLFKRRFKLMLQRNAGGGPP